MKSKRTLAAMSWDVLRGVILGLLLSYGILRIVQVNPDSILFKYAGY